MKTMNWLLRREFWEHKGAFFWAPAVIAIVMLVFTAGSIGYAFTFGNGHVVVEHTQHGSTVIEHTRSNIAITGLPPEMRSEVARVAATHYLGVAGPLVMVLPFVVFFYCLGALYDDRRDRSILFWKSLPISDQDTVLSKAITALCVAPAITVVLGIATALATVLLAAAAVALAGVNLFAPLLANPNLYLAPLYLVGLMPVYLLWALPTVGWLLMVSSWARSKVFLWAVGTPLITVAILKWINLVLMQYSDTVIDTHWFVENVVARGLAGLIPGVWLPMGRVDVSELGSKSSGLDLGALFSHSWMTLAQPGVWAGAVAGIAMLVVAMRLRRWRDEG